MPILDDQTFLDYGGKFRQSTPTMRQIAYNLAQEKIEYYLGTWIGPRIATGVWAYPLVDNRYLLVPANLIRVIAAVGIYDDAALGTSERYTGTAYVLDSENSVVAVYPHNYAGCYPTRLEMVFEAGVSVGYITGSYMAMKAMVMAAQDEVDSLLDPDAPNSAGMPGVISWSSMTHSETYAHAPKESIFGSSHRATEITRLLRPLRVDRVGKL